MYGSHGLSRSTSVPSTVSSNAVSLHARDAHDVRREVVALLDAADGA